MKRWISILLVLAMAMPVAAQQEEGPATARGQAVDTTGKGYTAAYVIEVTTRRVLLAENEHTPLPVASMAKMMTLLITIDEIARGNLKWDTPVTISARATGMGGSQVYLRAASVWPVKNLVIATMVGSANDAAEALAEKVGGSREAFVDMMNRKARDLQLTHSQFFDPHGLPAQDPARNDVMCAYDLAVLGLELMKHPFMRQLAVIPDMPFKNGTLERIYNPNRMINPRHAEYYDSATGIKTGYTGPAGYCITASASRNNMDLVAVVMGAKSSRGAQSSFGIAARLFNDAFRDYRMHTAVKKGSVVGQAAVSKGASDQVPAVAASDAGALVKTGQDTEVKVSFSSGSVTAPVKKGQPVGTVVLTSGGQIVAKVSAVADADVPRQSWWKAFWPF